MQRFIALQFLLIALHLPFSASANNTNGPVIPKWLPGNPHYKLVEPIANDGLINTYTLQTDYGRIRVEGTPLLIVRAHELSALARMQQLEESDVFKQALEKSAASPLRGATALIEDPIPTLKGAASGVGRWLSDVGRAIASNDPHQANVAKTALGQSTAKRAFAYQFGVDPYSSFKPLQEKLDDLAWAAAGGGMTIKAVFSMIPDVVGTVVSVTGTSDGMKMLVRDSSPAQLEAHNRNMLKSMKVRQNLVDALIGNPSYTPQELTILIAEIDGMKSIRSREKLLSAAAGAEGEARAVFMRYRTQMIANYLKQTKAKGKFIAIAQTIFLKTDDGAIVGHFPVDSVRVTPEFSSKLLDFDQEIGKLSGVNRKIMFIGGGVDSPVLIGLKAAGWTVVDHQFHPY